MRIVVLGGGVCGLAAAMMLARDGHAVTVLERDAEPPPESTADAWDAWSRAGVTQFRQSHILQARGRAILDEELPDVVAALEAAGATRFDPMVFMAPSIADRARRPDDGRFVALAVRRPVLEQVSARAAQSEANVDVCRGVAVGGLELRSYDGTPHVAGVRTASGEQPAADVVVDAMGRRSQLPRWLSEVGVAPGHEDAEDSGFMYYTQYFRSPDGAVPPARGPLLVAIGSFSMLTLPGDDATWSVTLFTSTGDRPLKRFRDRDRFHAVVAACPRHAHWLDGAEMTGVPAMSGVIDRYRRLVVDAARSPPASCRWPMPGRARTRRSAAACRSACCTCAACATSSASTGTTHRSSPSRGTRSPRTS